jgi:hypothetical protein
VKVVKTFEFKFDAKKDDVVVVKERKKVEKRKFQEKARIT